MMFQRDRWTYEAECDICNASIAVAGLQAQLDAFQQLWKDTHQHPSKVA